MVAISVPEPQEDECLGSQAFLSPKKGSGLPQAFLRPKED